MRTLKNFLQEERKSKNISLLKSYILRSVKQAGIKIGTSSRGGYHIRFPLSGEMKDFQSFF